MTMEQTETLAEDVSSAKELESRDIRKSRSVLPDRWIQGWQEFEARIRERPGLYFLAALAVGYLFQALPCRAFLGLIGSLCLRLVRPILFLAGAIKLAEYLLKAANSK
jgi:hypothetical protein